MYKYHIDTFVPPAPGCGKPDAGWDAKRCEHFAAFLNGYGSRGWKLHSCEYRQVLARGCGNNRAVTLVCVFEAMA